MGDCYFVAFTRAIVLEGYVMDYTYAVITGASSGIGEAFAKLLALKGHNLILVARRGERLAKLAHRLSDKFGVRARTIVADLSREEECYRVLDEIEKLPVEIFINNAGFGECGSWTETPLDKELAMTDLNVKAVQIFTKRMAQRFAKADAGYLLNVASIAGILPGGPHMAAYYASKAYVTSLTRAVAFEMKEMDSNAYVGALCPGPVDTEFNDVAHSQFSFWRISPNRCASIAYREMLRRRTIIIPGLPTKFAALGSNLMPKSALLSMVAKQQYRREG